MIWVERDLKGHLVPIPLPWAGTCSTRPGCLKPQPSLQVSGHFKGGGIHNFSGKPVPVPHHQHSK